MTTTTKFTPRPLKRVARCISTATLEFYIPREESGPSEERLALRRLLQYGCTRCLTPAQQQLTRLRYTDGLTVTAIAEQMGLAPSSVSRSLGVIRQRLYRFTEEVARAVSAMDISAEEATASLGKLITIFNIPALEFRNVIAALSSVADASTATATQLFDVVRRIGDLGGAVNIQGATAISAAMIDLGMTAETAGTTITKIFSKMRVDAEKFAAFVGNGMTVDKWVAMLKGDGSRVRYPENVEAARNRCERAVERHEVS